MATAPTALVSHYITNRLSFRQQTRSLLVTQMFQRFNAQTSRQIIYVIESVADIWVCYTRSDDEFLCESLSSVGICLLAPSGSLGGAWPVAEYSQREHMPKRSFVACRLDPMSDLDDYQPCWNRNLPISYEGGSLSKLDSLLKTLSRCSATMRVALPEEWGVCLEKKSW